MSTQLRRWALRILGAVALPVMLTLGLAVSASAQPAVATYATSSTQHASTHYYWERYGPYYSSGSCYNAQHQQRYRGHSSYCQEYRYRHDNRYYYYWYLYVRYPH